MNKKLLAVAIAGVLAAPTAALAQSSVTISGVFKMSVEQFKIGNAVPARAGTNTGQGLLADDSSRIIFSVVEDLGGGLSAIGQIDWRVIPDSGGDSVTGNSWVGLRSKTWGRIFVGRQDIHYFNRESELTVRNDLKADSISLLAFAGGGGTAIAGATRTTNLIHYTTPDWGGFTMIGAYSFNPVAVEADIGAAARRGRAWHLNPNLAGKNYQVGYSYWSQKADGAGAGSDQRGDRLYGSYRWGGFMIGAAWDKSKITNGTTGVRTSDRTAWSLPLQYEFGPHYIGGHFTKARDDKSTVVQDGARMWAIGYAYNLSKRTSLGVTYASIRNDVGAFYVPFTSTGGIGAASNSIFAGEDPRLWSVTIRHAF